MKPRAIAIIGSGPRGISILERMAVRLAQSPPQSPLIIYLLDAVEVGCGRIWRTDQPDYLLMNTVADEITMFSGPPRPDTPPRPGAGPSFAQWWQQHGADWPGPNSYAPRVLYGQYLHFVVNLVEESLPHDVTLLRIQQTVTGLRRAQSDGYHLGLNDGSQLRAHRVVLTTGHATPRLTGTVHRLHAFAAHRPHLTYVPASPVADMPLDKLRADSAVGVLGLGLSFYDVMAALTLGRGGRFTEASDGRLCYEPSGREPRLYAGSRSGMLMPARGVNQKPVDQIYEPVVFTERRVARLKAGPKADFLRDVFPWLRAEMDVAATLAVSRPTTEPATLARFVQAVADAARQTCPNVATIAACHGLRSAPAADLDMLAQPFKHRKFSSPEDFHVTLCAEVDADLREADRGNVHSPRKASLDVLRDVRWLICDLVDFASLTPSSHEHDFLGWYAPRSAFLVSGPPRIRLQQALALITAGVLRVLGPQTSFIPHPAGEHFLGRSAAVRKSEVLLDALVDARVPVPDIRLDSSHLTRDLLARGVIQPYRNDWRRADCADRIGNLLKDGSSCAGFETGGTAVTHSPYHPLSASGVADRGICVLGIPTEHTRWFMTMGGRRPGLWSQFDQDADDIAASVLCEAPVNAPVPAHAS
ncbi:FAD/NAD(P)-binding protein [Streptomyces asiaticus]|uniref:FAD/NAD(P)-binding protein n=1 Tax=Streptomyces asiaticus TaxID=114695 RepID=UPI003F669738